MNYARVATADEPTTGPTTVRLQSDYGVFGLRGFCRPPCPLK